MDFEKFVEYVQDGIEKILGDGYKTSVISVDKNNGVKLDGLVVRHPGENISPTIYLNEPYEQYCQGRSKAEIVNEIYRMYRDGCLQVSIDTEFFWKYENVHQYISCRLVHYEKNKEFLKNIPCVRFLDLAIVFAVNIPEMDGWTIPHATFLIRDDQLKIWNIDIGDVYRDALYRTPEMYPSSIRGIEEMLVDLLGEKLETVDMGEMRELVENEERMLFVLTNHVGVHGAACILYHHVLKEFADKQECNLFLLPSSIHEVLLVPENEKVNPCSLKETVMEVNRHELSEEEFLSDSIYYYDRKTDNISVYDCEC